MPRSADTYRGARRNSWRSHKARKNKALRKQHNLTRSVADFTRHLHPASYRVMQLCMVTDAPR